MSRLTRGHFTDLLATVLLAHCKSRGFIRVAALCGDRANLNHPGKFYSQ